MNKSKELTFKTFDDFSEEYNKYYYHECTCCEGLRELEETLLDIVIEDRIMHFKEIFVLSCTKCHNWVLPMFSKNMIDGCYKTMVSEGQYRGIFTPKAYREKYDYCTMQEFKYDHRDYYNIPGLSFDNEHSKEGFLTPVFFTKKSLYHFLYDPDYRVNLFSETYGTLSHVRKWLVPFGINRNGRVLFWLGDLNEMDEYSLNILKPHNVESDHQLIISEFYAAQMCCIWSNPNEELSICKQKKDFFNIINDKYNISLFHLDNEIEGQINNFQKPLVITEKSIEPSINLLHKVLIEGVNINELRSLYLQLVSSPKKGYKSFKSIKLYEGILETALSDNEDLGKIMSSLYLLNDLRQYYDHLLSESKKDSIKNNVIKSLGVESFMEIEIIYSKILKGLSILFEYLIIGLR